MDAVEFLKQFNRMCKTYNDDGCKECPAYRYRCGEEFDEQEEDGVSIVEQWAKEHPVKTRQSEFLKMYPDAVLDNNGILFIPPCQTDKTRISNDGKCPFEHCIECRRDFWLKEVHENKED